MTDAMRAARDRWLANPDSAGAGAAFEAGWYARNEEMAELERNNNSLRAIVHFRTHDLTEARARAEALRGILAGIVSAAGEGGKDIRPGFGRWAYELAWKVITVDPTAPTSDATTGEGPTQ